MATSEVTSLSQRMKRLGVLVAIPTYNNQNTLKRVVEEVLKQDLDVLVVNDGSTDDTAGILDSFGDRIKRLDFEQNQGKGMALRAAFKYGQEKDYTYLLSIDSDGQHFPSDIPLFADEAEKCPGALIMGARDMAQAGVPGKSSFGNKFSNFWFYVETGIKLPDTQTGFRLYPLAPIKKLKLFTRKFELEIEVIVKLAWQGVPVRSVPVKVKYDPNERVTHFRPFKDFTRIGIIHTYAVVLTLFWYLPKRLLKRNIFKLIRDEALKQDESPAKKGLAIGFGIFFGIIPIWGFQLLLGIPFAIFCRLNKVLFITAANISIPPMIPVVIAASYLYGELFYGSETSLPPLSQITLTDIHLNFIQYVIGACLLAVSTGLASGLFTYFFVKLKRKLKAG